MTNLRIGHGYDVHRLTERRRLVLGAWRSPGTVGCWATRRGRADPRGNGRPLRRRQAGDIGKLFPDSDPRYAGISSLELLRQVAALLQERGWAVVNIDATLIAQAPKGGPLPPGDGGEPLRSSWDGCGPGECEGHYRGASGLYRGRLRYGGPCGGAAGTAPLKKDVPRARPFRTSAPPDHRMGREEECLWSTI